MGLAGAGCERPLRGRRASRRGGRGGAGRNPRPPAPTRALPPLPHTVPLQYTRSHRKKAPVHPEPILVPKLRIQFADFTYLPSLSRPEAAHLGDLMRFPVRPHTRLVFDNTATSFSRVPSWAHRRASRLPERAQDPQRGAPQHTHANPQKPPCQPSGHVLRRPTRLQSPSAGVTAPPLPLGCQREQTPLCRAHAHVASCRLRSLRRRSAGHIAVPGRPSAGAGIFARFPFGAFGVGIRRPARLRTPPAGPAPRIQRLSAAPQDRLTRGQALCTRNLAPRRPSRVTIALDYVLLPPRSAPELRSSAPHGAPPLTRAPRLAYSRLSPFHTQRRGGGSGNGSSVIHFRGYRIRQVGCNTLFNGWRLPCPPPCCLHTATPFMGSLRPSATPYPPRSVHPASPVLLTKNGPLGARGFSVPRHT